MSEPNDNSTNSNTDNTTNATPAGIGGSDLPRTFTQAELDEVLKDRLDRERKKFADYGEIKKELDQLKADAEKRKKAEMSEVERLQAEIKDIQAKHDEIATRYVEMQMRGAVEREAAKLGFHDPSDAYLMLDFDGLELDDDGTSVKGADKAVAELAKAKPHLLKQFEQHDIDGKKRGKANQTSEEELIDRAAQKWGIRA